METSERLLRREMHDVDRAETPKGERVVIVLDDPAWGAHEIGASDEHFVGVGGIAEAGSLVDRAADVVLALEHEHFAGCDPDANLERRTHVFALPLQVEREPDGLVLFDGDDHAAVTQPLVDANAALGRHVANLSSEPGQNLTGRGVAIGGGVLREPREVDEDEGSLDFHGRGQATGRARPLPDGFPTGDQD